MIERRALESRNADTWVQIIDIDLYESIVVTVGSCANRLSSSLLHPDISEERLDLLEWGDAFFFIGLSIIIYTFVCNIFFTQSLVKQAFHKCLRRTRLVWVGKNPPSLPSEVI